MTLLRLCFLSSLLLLGACDGPEAEFGPCMRDALKQSDQCLDFCKRSMPRRTRNACRIDCVEQHTRRAEWCEEQQNARVAISPVSP